MRNPRSLLLAVLVAVIACLTPASALAKTESGVSILRSCEHHGYQLPGHYSVAALTAAYNAIPPASREYQTCAQVISDKINVILSHEHVHGGGGSGGGSGFPVVIVVIVVIVLVGAGGAFYSYRRSRQ